MSLSKPWKEWKKKDLYEALSEEQRTALFFRDALDDLQAGVQRWVDVKSAGLDWDAEDEALARWVEGNEQRYPCA